MDTITHWASVALAWAVAHPEWSIPIAVYLVVNVMPRKPPTNPTLRRLWGVSERLMMLSWDRWGGRLKALGLVLPEAPKE